MRPLRPHNYYGGTTCPGRVTGQVSTIRSLIPKEEDMPLDAADKVYLEGLRDSDREWLGRQLDWMWRHLLTETNKHTSAAGAVTRQTIAGGGNTPDEIKEAVKDAHREGTG